MMKKQMRRGTFRIYYEKKSWKEMKIISDDGLRFDKGWYKYEQWTRKGIKNEDDVKQRRKKCYANKNNNKKGKKKLFEISQSLSTVKY